MADWGDTTFMKQSTLATAGFGLVTKRTRKRVFLDEMNLVVPWTELVNLIQPFASSGTTARGGRPSFPVEAMLRIHFLQQWFGLSDPAMEEALHDISLYCEFARLDPGAMRLPDETTILRFRHLLEKHNLSIQLLATINATLATKGLMLKTGTVVDATLIAAPSSTKNSSGERDPEMHQTKKGNQCQRQRCDPRSRPTSWRRVGGVCRCGISRCCQAARSHGRGMASSDAARQAPRTRAMLNKSPA